jgi:hypothetical protein
MIVDPTGENTKEFASASVTATNVDDDVALANVYQEYVEGPLTNARIGPAVLHDDTDESAPRCSGWLARGSRAILRSPGLPFSVSDI